MAKKLKMEGVQFIKLYGGFRPTWIAKINEALDYEIMEKKGEFHNFTTIYSQ